MLLNAKALPFKAFVGVAGLGLLFLALFLAALTDRRPLAFESLESKTHELTPVFNRLTFVTVGGRDVWMMQQSHDGFPASEDQWDAVDRISVAMSEDEAGVAQATFLQLEPGSIASINQEADSRQIRGFKAPCGMCHSNGPRAIRPNLHSAVAPLSAWDQWRVFAWNLKLKSYGRTSVGPSSSERIGPVPFHFTTPGANEPLKVRTCAVCHRATGPFARGVLTKQNMLSIRFMVEKGAMPPLWMPLPEADRRALAEFLTF